jgi:hypothetical protein
MVSITCNPRSSDWCVTRSDGGSCGGGDVFGRDFLASPADRADFALVKFALGIVIAPAFHSMRKQSHFSFI